MREVPDNEATAAFRELLDTLRDLDRTFLDGDRAVTDDLHVADGYRQILTTLGVALDTYLFPDPSRPQFVDVNTPFRRDRRWGGDNTDAYYALCPVDPARRYRISGNRGDSVYFLVTAYNEPAPGTWSDRVVAVVRDTDLEYDDEGRFTFDLGPLPDAAVAAHPRLPGGPAHRSPDRLADRGVRRARADPARLHRDRHRPPRQRGLAPHDVRHHPAHRRRPQRRRPHIGHEITQLANEFGEPYQVGDANFGWSARDASYSFGSFVLEDDEALVVTHRPPACRFWNFVVWNQFMATHNATDDRCSVNGTQAAVNSDGTVTVVVARRRLEHPNAVSTVDYPRGNLAFRWFLADETPTKPDVRLVKAAEAPTAVS